MTAALGAVHLIRGEGLPEHLALTFALGADFNCALFAMGFDDPDGAYESEEAQLGARLRREWVSQTTSGEGGERG